MHLARNAAMNSAWQMGHGSGKGQGGIGDWGSERTRLGGKLHKWIMKSKLHNEKNFVGQGTSFSRLLRERLSEITPDRTLAPEAQRHRRLLEAAKA